MNNDDLYQKGMEIRRTLHGEASFKKSNAVTYGDPLMTNFIKVATTSVFGALWARPGLDLKTRALVVMVGTVPAAAVLPAGPPAAGATSAVAPDVRAS